MLDHSRRAFRGCGNNRDVEILFRRVFLELRNGTNRQRLPSLSDFCFIDVVNRGDDESALGEPAITGEGSADLTSADDADAPLFAEAEYLAQLLGKLRD